MEVAEEAEATEVIEVTEDLVEVSLKDPMKLVPLIKINSQPNKTKLPNDMFTKSLSRLIIMQ